MVKEKRCFSGLKGMEGFCYATLCEITASCSLPHSLSNSPFCIAAGEGGLLPRVLSLFATCCTIRPMVWPDNFLILYSTRGGSLRSESDWTGCSRHLAATTEGAERGEANGCPHCSNHCSDGCSR